MSKGKSLWQLSAQQRNLEMAYEREASVLAQFRQRGITILQTEGIAGLMKRVVQRLRHRPLHHRSYIFGQSLDHPIDPPEPKVEVEIGQVKATDDEDLETVVEIDPWADSKADLLRCLAKGHRCYVARHEGRIVPSVWCAREQFYSHYLGRELRLAANEIWCHSAVTKPVLRRKGIMSYLLAHSGRDLARNQNKAYGLATVRVTNRAVLRSIAKAGVRAIGWVGLVEILGIRFHYLWGRRVFQETTKRCFVERVQ